MAREKKALKVCGGRSDRGPLVQRRDDGSHLVFRRVRLDQVLERQVELFDECLDVREDLARRNLRQRFRNRQGLGEIVRT